MKILILAMLVLSCLMFHSSAVKAEQNIWNLKELSKAPDYTEYNIPMYGEKSWGYAGILKKEEERQKDKENNYVRAILYKGPDYKGRETRVFAYIGVPPAEEGKKVPGIVLVHGGGGGAFEAWVRLWNARGYAAIAMDTVGAESINEYTGKTMEQGCNSSWGDFANINEPIKDQWGYQAVANVILANSLLRSIPEIDKDNIGITGISWGGYLTCIASSIDTRFKYAIPIYGCGYLKDYSPATVGPLFSQPQADQDKWFSLWDPSVYLKERTVPIHWIVSNTDAAYYLLGVKKSYECVPNNRKTITVRDLLPHDHGSNGESQPETLAWADYYTYGTDRMPRITAQNFKNGIYTFKTSKNAVKAVLYTSKNPNPIGHGDLTADRTEFDFKEVAVSGCCGQVKIPEDTKVFYLNVFTEDGLEISGNIIQGPQK